ncbi:MAG: ROK family protein [Spirochaetota bacterium]
MASILCGVDLGGTKLGIGLVSESGTILDSSLSKDHVFRTPDEVVGDIATRIRGLMAKNGYAESDLRGIGLGVAGHLRYRDGVAITISNLEGWKGYPLRERLGQRFPGLRILVDNDANAQALGEYKYGAGVGFRNMVFMTISTQIGAGIVLDGRILRGMTGTAGEIGHTIVEASSAELCPCGNRGCLIAHASTVAIAPAVRRRLSLGMTSTLVNSGNLDRLRLDGEFIARGLVLGDQLCVQIMEEFARYIGIGIYNVFQVFNPEAVVLGGGLMNWGAPFLEGITRSVRTLARDMMYEELAILPGSLDAPGIVGAASLVLES